MPRPDAAAAVAQSRAAKRRTAQSLAAAAGDLAELMRLAPVDRSGVAGAAGRHPLAPPVDTRSPADMHGEASHMDGTANSALSPVPVKTPNRG